MLQHKIVLDLKWRLMIIKRVSHNPILGKIIQLYLKPHKLIKSYAYN